MESIHGGTKQTDGHVRSTKISQRLARMIAREIAEAQTPPGSTLPSEELMAKQYAVGRASVREALRLLEAQGAVVVRPGKGGGPEYPAGTSPAE